MTNLDVLREEILFRKQEAFEILATRFTEDRIKELCRQLVTSPDATDIRAQVVQEGGTDGYFWALVSLCCFMDIQCKLPPSPEYIAIETESAADLILVGINAALTLTQAGWQPSEKYALERLKMIRNQPNTRRHANIERQDIEDVLEGYIHDRGRLPVDFHHFIRILEGKGYVINHATRTINSPEGANPPWRKAKSFGTVDNWRRGYKMKFHE
jgi:hypothetical protein